MEDYPHMALRAVREYAAAKSEEAQEQLDAACRPYAIDARELIQSVLAAPITVNFHVDRLSGNGKTIIENLLQEGRYHSQFRTGTTNGGKSAYPGGDRFLWEQRIFHDTYPQGVIDRPKYGALNIFRHIDGAAPRFGACFFVLHPKVVERCTFAYGDSATNPATLCTHDTFAVVLAMALEDVRKRGRLLNRVIAWEQEALAILMYPVWKGNDMGRSLESGYIETHIHGDVLLERDVDALFVDVSYQNTPFAEQVERLCEAYRIELRWIPERQIEVTAIGEIFRGPMIPPLARKIDVDFGQSRGILDAALIGQASRDISLYPERWKRLGNEAELFQAIKQLWHTVAYFG